MSTNRSKSRGHKPTLRPSKKSRNRFSPTADNAGRVPATNLILIAPVGGSSLMLDVTMDRPVIAGTPSPVDTAAFVLAASGGTSRHAISAINHAPNIARVTLDGALTASKSYVGTLALTQGIIVPTAGQIGTHTGAINT